MATLADPRTVRPTIFVSGLIVLTLLAVVIAGQPPSTFVAGVFPPWWDARRSLEAAASAGDIVATGRIPSIVIVHADDGTAAARLRAAGALFVVGTGFFISCLS